MFRQIVSVDVINVNKSNFDNQFAKGAKQIQGTSVYRDDTKKCQILYFNKGWKKVMGFEEFNHGAPFFLVG